MGAAPSAETLRPDAQRTTELGGDTFHDFQSLGRGKDDDVGVAEVKEKNFPEGQHSQGDGLDVAVPQVHKLGLARGLIHLSGRVPH